MLVVNLRCEDIVTKQHEFASYRLFVKEFDFRFS